VSAQLELIDDATWPNSGDLAELGARIDSWTATRAVELDQACVAHDVADSDLLARLPLGWTYDVCRACGDRVAALMRAESKARR
jgi:hypothetical protein